MTDGSNSTLILIPATYPWEQFVDNELPYLSSTFERVIILPRYFRPNYAHSKTGESYKDLPQNVIIDTSLLPQDETPIKIIFHKLHSILMILMSRELYKEVLRNPGSINNINHLKRIAGHLSEALRTQKWILHQYVQQSNITLEKTVFYTYWISGATMGIGMAKERYPEIKLVSRAHRGDLYEECYDPPYIPYHYKTLTLCDRIYLISEHGYDYLAGKYPHIKDKLEVARLGVEDPRFITEPSKDGIFRIVSCSYVVPVKRLDLLIRGLKTLAQQHHEKSFKWIHIGSGPLIEQMEELARKCLPGNISFHFLGYVPDVISLYQNNKVDIFINVSSSEGIPVSIMEAQSCGIPVIATSVGGTPEIVSNGVGVLLSNNPSPQRIADAIWALRNNSSQIERLRENIKFNYNKRYNAENNYREFSSKLKNI